MIAQTILKLLAFNLIVNICWAQPVNKTLKHSYMLRDHINKIKKNKFTARLREFIDASGESRLIGTAGHEQTRSYLQTLLSSFTADDQTLVVQDFEPDTAAGIKLYKDDFQKQIVGKFDASSEMFKKWNNFTNYMSNMVLEKKNFKGRNFIWEKKGLKDDSVLIVTAHYDTISHDKNTLLINTKDPMPGADYNGSGVNIALHLVELLNKIKTQNTIRVVFLDYQGIGVLGSHAYAQKLSSEKKQILGVINLEMLGHDSKVFDKKSLNGNMSLYLRSSEDDQAGYMKDMELVKIFEKYKNKCDADVKFEVKANGFKNSDHVRFWEQGMAAITFSQNWEDDFNEKGYQTKNDFVETLNHQTLYGSYKLINCFILSHALAF